MTSAENFLWSDLEAFRARQRRDNPIPAREAVPAELVGRPQWLIWRYEPGETPEKKPRKMPYYPDGGRRFSEQGSVSDRRRLKDFDGAAEKAAAGFDGVGFAFLPDDGLIGIDLDGMIDPESGVISERCSSIIAACASYTEWSPSGKGVHILCRGSGVTTKSNRIGVEVFVGRQYFTFTGRRWPGAPETVNALAPAVLRRLEATVKSARAPAAAAGPAAPVPPKPEMLGGKARSLAETVALAEEAIAALDADDYQQWIDVGMACKAGLGTAGYYVWDAWSARSPKYAGAEDTQKRFRGFSPERITLGTLFGLAEQAGWISPWEKARRRLPRANRPMAEDAVGAAPTAAPRPAPSARAKAPAGGGDDEPPRQDDDADETHEEMFAWQRSLIRKSGTVLPCLANAALVVDRMPLWDGVIGYDEFAERTVYRRRLPFDEEADCAGEWSDHLDVMTAIWMQRTFRVEFSPTVVGQAVEACARRHRFHPVREALLALPPWDGTRRLPFWVSDYLGVEQTDYSALVGTYFIRGMIRRVMHVGPDGFKFDYCPVLEGPQGMGKSEVCRILAWHWFCDTDLDLSNKDSLLALPGHWVYEIPELGGLMKAEERKQKSFLSRQSDEFRPPYGKRLVKVPRQNVFIGTTNEEEYLKDPTGGRRFWPLRCGEQFNLDGLRGAREQLFAEAVADWRANERCWPSREEQKRWFDPEQAKRGMQEPLDDLLQEWVRERAVPFSMADAAVDALKLSADKLTPAITTRIGLALRRLGCTREEDRLADDPSRRRLYVTKGMAGMNPLGGIKSGKVGGNDPF